MFEKLDKTYRKVQDKLNLFDIGEKLSEFFVEEFQAEVCEIKYLEENEVFSRVHCAVRKNGIIVHDQGKIEKLFGVKSTPAGCSLIGYCTEREENYVWVKKNIDFKTWVYEKKREPVYEESAVKYIQKMPSGNINNFIILPIIIPDRDRGQGEIYTAKLCFHLFNLCNGSIEEDKIDTCIQKIKKVFNYISIILFNAIFYNRAKNEIHINRNIIKITTEAENIENAMESVVEEFARRLNAPLTTIWFPDHDLQLLVLHSFYIKTDYSKFAVNEKCIRKKIEKDSPKILKVDDSLIGDLFSRRDLPWLKESDLKKDKYKWKAINEIIGTDQLIALPIRYKEELIAIIALHPNLSVNEFEKIPLSYFRSFTKQISITLKYFMAKSFSQKAIKLSEKLTNLVSKREEIFYNELVFKIKEVIDAEACSIFEARGGNSSEKGIYLKATTDKREEAKKKIGTKIYDINFQSITGYVALTGEPTIVYDVERVNDFIPKVKSMSKNFMEKTEAPLHTSYIAVPIPQHKHNFDDRKNSVLILRCINKKKTADRTLTGIFSVDDKHLLKYVAAVLESFNIVIKVLYERNDLIDLIIHEIENPIVSIRGKIDFIMNVQLSEKRLTQKLKDIEEMAYLLKGWSSNMVLLNQLMQGKKLSPNREWVGLWFDIIEHVIFWMSPVFKSRGIYAGEIDKGGLNYRLKVNTDKDHLRQVFYNLLSNAVKYTKNNEKPKIAIEVKERENELVVKVKDWGVGIGSEEAEHICKMGIRGNYAKKKNIKGKGFGLWLCTELLDSNNFKLKITKCENPTTFEVVLPQEYCK